MYGVAWIIVGGVVVVVGLLIAFVVAASPLFAILALVVAAIAAFAYFSSRRGRLGTERQRVAGGQTTTDATGAPRAAPPAGEGGAPGRDEREGYEPAV